MPSRRAFWECSLQGGRCQTGRVAGAHCPTAANDQYVSFLSQDRQGVVSLRMPVDGATTSMLPTIGISSCVRCRRSSCEALRNVARAMCSRQMLPEEIDAEVEEYNIASSLRANLAVVRTLNTEIKRLEREVLGQVSLATQFELLLSITGVGNISAGHHARNRGDLPLCQGGQLRFLLHAAWTASACPTTRRKAKAIPSAATSIWPGPLSRLPTSPCATAAHQTLLMSAKRPRPTES